MKNKLTPIAAVALGLALVTTSLTYSGCNTTPTQQTVTVNTLLGLGQSVNAAFAAYSDLLIAGKVSTNSLPQISAAYADFQLAFASAVRIAQSNTNAPPPPELAAAGAKLITTLNQQKGAQ